MRKSLIFPVVNAAASRCAVCCWKTGYAAARRTDQPPRRRVRRRLERFLHDFEGTVVAITHDRYFLDNVAGWILELDRGEGIPWEGNYSSAGAERPASGARSFSGSRTPQIYRERTRVGSPARKAVSLGKAARRALKSLTTLNIRNVTKLTNCSFRRPASGR